MYCCSSISLQGMNLMCITCFLDERSAKLKHEGMDRMRVALVGSPPNCFLSLMGDLFGYQDSVPTPSDLTAPPSEPAPATTLPAALRPKDPAAYQTLADIRSGPEYAGPTKGPQPTLPTPYQAGVSTRSVGPKQSCLPSFNLFLLRERIYINVPSQSANSIHARLSTQWHVILDVTSTCLSAAIIATNWFGAVKGGCVTARLSTLVFLKCL